MKLKLSLTDEADKFLERLDAKQFRQVVRTILSLADDPLPADSIKLAGSSYRRADQGEFRIVYAYDSETLHVYVVGKRNDDGVYRRVTR